METKPVRYAEAPWVFNRWRYVRMVPTLKTQWWAALTGISVQVVLNLIEGRWGAAAVTFVVTATIGLFAFWQSRRAWAFFRAHYRPPELADEVGMVTLELAYMGYVYGRDLGFLTVDDHYVTFEGSQTTFSLSARHLIRHGTSLTISGFEGYRINILEVGSAKTMDGWNVPSIAEIELRLGGLSDAPFESGEVVGVPPLRPPAVNVPNRIIVFGLAILAPIALVVFSMKIGSGFWVPLAIVLTFVAIGFAAFAWPATYRRLQVERKFAKLGVLDR